MSKINFIVVRTWLIILIIFYFGTKCVICAINLKGYKKLTYNALVFDGC